MPIRRPSSAAAARTVGVRLAALLAVQAAALCLSGCLFHTAPGPSQPDAQGTAAMRLRLIHSAGSGPLAFDTTLYRTPAGSLFSVEALQYYLSGFHLLGEDGDTLYASDSVFYVDARDSATWTRVLRGLPAGHVHTYGFTFGIARRKNRTGSLPPTLENLNMAWPEPMGGGYHFMKLEGRLLDSLSRPYGYYIHIGNLGEGTADNAFAFTETRFPLHLSLAEGLTLELVLDMDALQWLSADAPYPLEERAQGVMGDGDAQSLLRRNGSGGVFRTREAEVGPAL